MKFEEGGMSLNQLKDYFGAENIDDNGSFKKSGGNAGQFVDDAKLRKFFINDLGREKGHWADGVSDDNDVNTVVRALYNGEGGEGDKEPFTPREMSEEHQASRAAYEESLASDPYKFASATEAYNKTFGETAAAGSAPGSMPSLRYLNNLADAKKQEYNNRQDHMALKNQLAGHEMNHAINNAIDKAAHHGLKPTELGNPKDMYDDYKSDIEEIGS